MIQFWSGLRARGAHAREEAKIILRFIVNLATLNLVEIFEYKTAGLYILPQVIFMVNSGESSSEGTSFGEIW